jgi:hypothetical protein
MQITIYPQVYAILLSFILASAWVSVSTIIAERYGTRTGGLVTTLPSTLIVAMYYMAQNGIGTATQAVIVVPAEMGINTVFLATFIAISSRGLPKALGVGIAAWFALSALVFLYLPDNLLISILVFLALASGTTIFLKKKHSFQQQDGKSIHYTFNEVAFRGLFAGGVIAFSVFLASASGPTVGGIFSVFPAIFTSTMAILYLRQGREFTGAAGSTMVLGSVNVVFYACAVYYSFPMMGAVLGTIFCVISSYLWSAIVFLGVTNFNR